VYSTVTVDKKEKRKQNHDMMTNEHSFRIFNAKKAMFIDWLNLDRLKDTIENKDGNDQL
jgi:hypothetical protein